MSDDYTKLIEELRSLQHSHEVQSDATSRGGVRRPDHAEMAKRYETYADAVEALLVENKTLASHKETWQRKASRVEAERDALQAQLNEMTTEWGTKNLDSKYGPDRDVWESENAARNIAKEYGETLVRRSVGPWTPVEGEQG